MRCKNCKEIFTQKRFNVKYCLEKDECVKAWNDERKAKDWKVKKKAMKESSLTVQKFAQDVQKTFNAYIRKRDEGKPCISCQKLPKKINAGHYFNANNHWNVRFDEDNVHLQCERCNTSLSANLIEYRKHLITKIGIERFESLEKRARLTRKFTIEELKKINEIYKLKLKGK